MSEELKLRRILFRGKVPDDKEQAGEWAEGGILHYGEGVIEHAYIIVGFILPKFIRVIPETVGQYTGLKDKNGVRIFEGDIVLWRRTESSGIPVRQTTAVFFEEGCFVIKMIDHFYKNGFAPNGISLYAQYELFDEAIRDYPQGNFKYEVIGNMHDNPELLDRE